LVEQDSMFERWFFSLIGTINHGGQRFFDTGRDRGLLDGLDADELSAHGGIAAVKEDRVVGIVQEGLLPVDRLRSEHGVQGVARMGFGFETDSVTHNSFELFLVVCADTGSTGEALVADDKLEDAWVDAQRPHVARGHPGAESKWFFKQLMTCCGRVCLEDDVDDLVRLGRGVGGAGTDKGSQLRGDGDDIGENVVIQL